MFEQFEAVGISRRTVELVMWVAVHALASCGGELGDTAKEIDEKELMRLIKEFLPEAWSETDIAFQLDLKRHTTHSRLLDLVASLDEDGCVDLVKAIGVTGMTFVDDSIADLRNECGTI
jgi:hypothetical protein